MNDYHSILMEVLDMGEIFSMLVVKQTISSQNLETIVCALS